MSLVFADSGSWIALSNPRDALHRRSMAAADGIHFRGSRRYTAPNRSHSHWRNALIACLSAVTGRYEVG